MAGASAEIERSLQLRRERFVRFRNGLVITNHHVGLSTLQKISSEEHNYVRDGFYARSAADEVKSTDLELNVLMSIEDVTQRVNAAVKPGMSPEAANMARQNAVAQMRWVLATAELRLLVYLIPFVGGKRQRLPEIPAAVCALCWNLQRVFIRSFVRLRFG
jgi:Peptidase S46